MGLVIALVVAVVLAIIVERRFLDGGRNAPSASAAPNRPIVKPSAGQPPRLEDVVAQLMTSERGKLAQMIYDAPGGSPDVSVTRQTADHAWAFGVAALPVPTSSPAMPQVALFLAHWEGRKWRAGISGTDAFRKLIRVVPTRLLPAEENFALAKFNAGPVTYPELMLPWQSGESRRVGVMTGPMTFDGGDVLAAEDGRLYRFCADTAGNGLLMIINDTGLATLYYRLADITKVTDGTSVRQGDYLGQAGGPGTCGGTTDPTVLFGLGQGDGNLSLSGRFLGGWHFRDGWAQRNDQQVMPGQMLPNFAP